MLRKIKSQLALEAINSDGASEAARVEVRRRDLHPNHCNVIRAIVADDVAGFCEELVDVRKRGPQPANTYRRGGAADSAGGLSKVISSRAATLDEEELVGRFALIETSGANAAHIAAANDAFNVLTFILDMRQIVLKDSVTLDAKWTPLHFAALNQHERICNLLRSYHANLEAEDAYGDKPYDIARALGNVALAERLGDATSTTDEAAAKKQAAYQQLLAKAKAFEAERAKEEAERLQQERDRAAYRERLQRQKEQMRAMKITFERQRLAFIRDVWLPSREKMHRDTIGDHFRIFCERLEVAMTKSAARYRSLEEDRVRREMEAAAAAATKGRGRKKAPKGGGRSKSGTAATAKAATAASASPSPSPMPVASLSPSPTAMGLPTGDSAAAIGVSGAADEAAKQPEDPVAAALAAFDAAHPCPEVTDRMNKDEAKAVLKLKQAWQKERKQVKDDVLKYLEDMLDTLIRNQEALEEEYMEQRLIVEQLWFSGYGNVAQCEPSLDRKHTGFFRFESFERRYRWSCCGQLHDPFAPGCVAAEDVVRDRRHIGQYVFHIVDCACGGEDVAAQKARQEAEDYLDVFTPGHLQKGGSGAASAKQLATGDRRGSSTAGIAHAASAGALKSDAPVAAGGARNQRRLGPDSFSGYCNPGGCCWSCCGAMREDAMGCSIQRRFLYAEHRICDVRFVPCRNESSASIPLSDVVVDLNNQREAEERRRASIAASPAKMFRREAERRSTSTAARMVRENVLDEENRDSAAQVIGKALRVSAVTAMRSATAGVDLETSNDADPTAGKLGGDSAIGDDYDDDVDSHRSNDALKYHHRLRRLDGPSVTLSGGRIRISSEGRCIEHLVPPPTAKSALQARGLTGVMGFTGRVTRINLLGNVVFRPEFLADARREEQRRSAELQRTYWDTDHANAVFGQSVTDEPHQPSLAGAAASPRHEGALMLEGDDGDTYWLPGVLLQANGSLPVAAAGSPVGASTSTGPSKPLIALFDLDPRLDQFRCMGSATTALKMPDSFVAPSFTKGSDWTSHQVMVQTNLGAYAAYGFEVRLTCLPPMNSVAEEHAVVGLVEADFDPEDEEESDESAEDTAVEEGEAHPDPFQPTRKHLSSRRKTKEGENENDDEEGEGEEDDAVMTASFAAAEAVQQQAAADAAAATAAVAHRRVAAESSSTAHARRSTSIRFTETAGDGMDHSILSLSDIGSISEDPIAPSPSSAASAPHRRQQRHSAARHGDLFDVSSAVRRFYGKEGRFISGKHGVGWWAHTSLIRGLGHDVDVRRATGGAPGSCALSEGDLLLFIVDGMNRAVHVFRNRAYTLTLTIPPKKDGSTNMAFIPAMTLTAGCRFEVEYYSGGMMQYVEHWWREKASAERTLRLAVDAKLYSLRLTQLDKARREASARGGVGTSSSKHPSTASGGSSFSAKNGRRSDARGSHQSAASASGTAADDDGWDESCEIRY